MNSKLSAQTFDDEELGGRILAAPSIGLMTIDAPHRLTHVPAGRIAVGRLLTLGEKAVSGMDAYNSTAEQVVERWFAATYPVMKLAPQVYWTGPHNEGGRLEDVQTMYWYGDIELRRQRKLAALGLKCATFNFSAEANIYDKFQPLVPALRTALELGNLYATHGYSSPRLTSSMDTLLNHRLLRAALGWLPLTVYTEFGADQVHHNQMNGWRQTGMSEMDYINDLVGVDQTYLAPDPDVVGAFVYLWTKQGRPEWTAYNLERGGDRRRPERGVGNMLLEHITNNPAAPFVSVPAPVPIIEVDPPVPQPRGTVAMAGLNIRTEPRIVDETKIGQFRVETPVEVLETRDGWSKIALFVKAEYLKGE